MLGGLRRSEVVRRRVFIAEGKGERQRVIPVSGRFFAALVLMAISVMPLSLDPPAEFGRLPDGISGRMI